MSDTKKIFVVDDDQVALEILKHQLSGLSNVEVELFRSAESCFEQMHKNPNLVILDLNLDSENKSNMTGHEALRKFQEEHNHAQLLFISGESNELLLEEYRKHRSVDYLIKNEYHVNYLLQKVKNKIAA